MCGICAVIAPQASPAWRRDILTRLLRASQARGHDATGIAYIDPTAGLIVVKDGVSADDFVKSKEYSAATKTLPSIVIGHTRSATGGGVASEKDNDNNHPFFGMDSGIAMVHNGIVNDTAWRKTVGADGGIKKKFVGGTDSEVFLRMVETLMEEGNPNPTMDTAIYDAAYNISGTYALMFIRRDEPNIIWLAAHSNPIVLAYNQKENYVIVASTEKIIEEAMSEYTYFLNFFAVESMPKMIINSLRDDYIMKLALQNEKPYIDITTRVLKPHPGGYTSNYRKGY